MLIAVSGCAGTPVVKPSCAISWDQSADYWRVAEYRLTVWRVNEQQTSDKSTHVVKAPATRVSCQDVGATKNGRWQATVQACLTDGTCSEASTPMSFQVAEN
jgi:NMD protein affecting ribosome stability and mRNA decay